MHFITLFAMAAFTVIAIASPTMFERTDLSIRRDCNAMTGNCNENNCQGDKSSDGITCTAVCKSTSQRQSSD